MTPKGEIDSEAADAEMLRWRFRFYLAAALSLVLTVVLLRSDRIEDGSVVACGVACGIGRVKVVRHGLCECADPHPPSLVDGR